MLRQTLRNILFAPDPPAGSGSTPAATPAGTPATPSGAPSEPPAAPPAASPSATPPPFAQIVATGTKTERELALERKLKERETRVSELEQENHTLRTPPPKPPGDPAPQKKHWLDGGTFFG